MKDKLGIGERMKDYYEKIWLYKLPMRMPVVIRLDGKNFHQFTKKMDRPFDKDFTLKMSELSRYLSEEIQTTVLVYGQSDEISLLLHNYKKLESQGWFNNELQKMVSVSSGLASAYFSYLFGKVVVFDSRAFVLPEAEVANYFIWRQQDATRNSIQMLARSLYSHKECYKKNTKDLQDMTMAKGKNWNDVDTRYKRGFCVVNGEIDFEIPIFTQDRGYIEKLLETEDL